MRTLDLVLWGLAFISLSLQSKATDGMQIPKTAPLNTNEALKSFTTEHGFQMQLVAAEPLVQDPVAAAFD